MTWNISTFMSWFITQFINIGGNLLGKLDNIIIYGNVSLMDFIITIVILGAFISIITTTANGGIFTASYDANQRIKSKERTKKSDRKQ